MRILSGTEFTTKCAGKPDTVFSSMLSYARIELKTVFGRKYSSTTGLLTHELYPPFWYSTLASTRQSGKVFVKALFSGAGFAMSFWSKEGLWSMI
jgi:hypothetical protein